MSPRSSEFRKCRLCGVNVKIRNFEKHFTRVHPRHINELEVMRPEVGKCIICGKKIPEKTSHACEEHEIKIIPRFLVRDALLPLREHVNRIVEGSGKECIDYFLQFFLLRLYAELGTNSAEIGHEELAVLSDRSQFLGYTLIRLCQSLPYMAERAYELASQDSGGGLLRTRYDTDFLEALRSEFEFFYGSYFGINGLFKIAVDSEESPTTLVIVPYNAEEAVLKMLMLRIKDSEFVFRSSLYPVIHATSEECVYDHRGTFFCYSRQHIIDSFDSFKSIWLRMLGSELPVNAKELLDFRAYFKWVVCPFGFTRQKKNKAYYLSDYKELDESTVFALLNMILPNPCSISDYVSTKMLGSKDPHHEVLHRIIRVAWGFRFSSSKGPSYYLPVIDWLYNLLAPILIRFGRTLNVAGDFCEMWIENVIQSFADGSLGFKYTEEFGFIPVRRKARKQPATDSWRILEKNLKIEIRDETSPTQAIQQGEIDLIVYANYNIYLLELKSVNLSAKKATKYLNRKAPIQCSKYAGWIRKQENLGSLMVKHDIPEHKLNSVRILCCTSGVFDKTSVKNAETGERFAVIPLFLMFNLFAGVFTSAIRDIFPPFIKRIKNGLHIALPSLHRSYLLDNREELSETANLLIQDWLKLMTFDRRLGFNHFGKVVPQSFTLAKFFLSREVHIGDTSNWILDRPLLLDTQGEYHFYVGTQIGVAGTTLVCLNCKSAVKYYSAPKEVENKKVDKILRDKKCPFCHESMKSARNQTKVIANMSKCVLKFRKKLDSQILDGL